MPGRLRACTLYLSVQNCELNIPEVPDQDACVSVPYECIPQYQWRMSCDSCHPDVPLKLRHSATMPQRHYATAPLRRAWRNRSLARLGYGQTQA